MRDPTRRGLLPFVRRLERSFVESQRRRQVSIVADMFCEDVRTSDGHRCTLPSK
jgi:hypothetical protein